MILRNNKGESIAEITPPYFKNVSFLQFSKSGRFLVMANEKGQYLYVYKLFPCTNFRHNRSENLKKTMLVYSLFRGYTAAIISDCVFSSNEKSICLSTLNGTSHYFILDEAFFRPGKNQVKHKGVTWLYPNTKNFSFETYYKNNH